jgi:hypothetical protein
VKLFLSHRDVAEGAPCGEPRLVRGQAARDESIHLHLEMRFDLGRKVIV